MDRTANFYAQPSYVGGGFPIFSGSRRMRGGGIFGSLARVALPFVKSVGRSVLNAGKHHALGFAKDVALDALSGKSIRDSAKKRGINRLKQLGMSSLKNTAEHIVGNYPKPSRKRKAAPRKAARKAPPAKRRRRRKANF